MLPLIAPLQGLIKNPVFKHRASPDADIYRPFRPFIYRKNFAEALPIDIKYKGATQRLLNSTIPARPKKINLLSGSRLNQGETNLAQVCPSVI